MRTAPLGLAFFQGQYTQGTALLAAGAVLVALPVVMVYLFLQRALHPGHARGCGAGVTRLAAADLGHAAGARGAAPAEAAACPSMARGRSEVVTSRA